MASSPNFSHLDPAGGARMVDVGAKPDQRRVAVAEGRLTCSPKTIALLRAQALPKGDVLTGLATATFADGSIPEAGDVAKIASNLFAAGQETTIRLLGTAFLRIGEDPDLQRRLRDDRTLIPNFIEECLRHESPVKGDFRMNRVSTTVGGGDVPAGAVMYPASNVNMSELPESCPKAM